MDTKSLSKHDELKSLEGKPVTSLDMLKHILDLSDGAAATFYVAMNGGAKSYKVISYTDKLDSTGKYKFRITNEIDGTKQILAGFNLFMPKRSNIGEAINSGALYYAWT